MSPEPLRIALVSEHASPLASVGSVDAGGQNVYVAHIAACLADAGHQVDVFTRRDDANLPHCLELRPGVRVVHLAAGPAGFVPKERLLGYMPAFAAALRRFVDASDDGYDVVHANFFMSGLAGLKLKEVFGLPLVMTFHALGLVRREHQGQADGFPAERVEIERRLVAQADRVIAECPQDRDDLLRLYGASDERISTVPCGVDTAQFAPGSRAQARRALGLPAEDFVVLQLGRLVPRKGIDNAIRAVAQLPSEMRARLLVVGGESRQPDERVTPEIARLKRVARDCGAAERVGFLGHRDRHELADFYRAADVFVTTPWYEPFGITPLEAMACATPVVGSAVGGIKYSVDDGVTGFLVPPHDPEALAERLVHLWANPELARAFGRAGVRRVRSLFNWQCVTEQLIDVYSALRWRAQAHPPQRLHGLPAGAETAGTHRQCVFAPVSPMSATQGMP